MTIGPRTRPDIDLADGSFYAGDSRAAYRWMRTHEPVFRDRNGMAGIASIDNLCDVLIVAVFPNTCWPDEEAVAGEVYFFPAGHILQ